MTAIIVAVAACVSDRMHRLTAALVAVFFATLVLVSSSQAGPVPEASR